jgi:hypothetical protein
MTRIIGVDSTFEDEVAICEAHRASEVYPHFEAEGHPLARLVGTAATRARVKAALGAPDVRLLTGSGHGESDRFTGDERRPVLRVGAYEPSEVAGRIVHLLACSAAAPLGEDLVAKGCVAFFGYATEFAFPADTADLFLECDSEIDRALAEGETAETAYERAFDAFTDRAVALDAAGQTFLAALALTLRDSLCAPSVDAKWGDPEARL